MSELLRYNKTQKYILYDFETQSLGLVAPFNKPWQLSFLVCEGNNILQENDNYIWWDDLKVSEDAARITHFDYSKYKRLATDPKEILDVFESYVYNPEYRIIFHNGLGFDVYVHNILRQVLGKKPDFSYLNRCIDTNCLAKAIQKNIKYNKDDDFLCFQMKLNNLHEKGLKSSLISQLKVNNIEFDEYQLHNGIYDCGRNWELFKKQIWQIEI